ncbi:transglutaminase family protein [Ovoidimarina sediminis]|uniref:transglutaminase family protein n=1 Tax=Ovoidimarina sediminis TaxID=3079856 RepID=UPI0029145A29|nr:transglutaminase family protein [Rhodophyticola sp. MJ-SS7]MDU8944995.1 transglutaminase family protein [Rhodophyticola sp. MJ-SS7]
MRLQVDHATTYHFDPPMHGVVQTLRLWPTECENQQTLDWQVDAGAAAIGAGFRDGAGDWVETATLMGAVESLTIRVTGTVETVDCGGVLKGLRERVPPQAYLRTTRATLPDRAILDLARSATSDVSETDVLARSHAIMDAVEEAIAYTPGETEHGTTAAEALALGHGVCQDHAHVIIAAARSIGIPARYVTGYLFASEEDGAHEASHAWAELYVPDLGWVGFDASNGKCPDAHYIRVGSGLDADGAAPIRGVLKGAGQETLDAHVSVDQVRDQGAQ